MSEVPVNYDDFVAILESSTNIDELLAIGESLEDEIAVQQAKDIGGQDGSIFLSFSIEIYSIGFKCSAAAVKQQLSSLKYVRQLVKRRIARVEGDDSVVRSSIALLSL